MEENIEQKEDNDINNSNPQSETSGSQEDIGNEQIDINAPISGDNNNNTRNWIAISFVIGFFVVILLCFIYSCCHDFSAHDLRDLLVTASGILSGSLGFVMGYYFKNGENKK